MDIFALNRDDNTTRIRYSLSRPEAGLLVKQNLEVCDYPNAEAVTHSRAKAALWQQAINQVYDSRIIITSQVDVLYSLVGLVMELEEHRKSPTDIQRLIPHVIENFTEYGLDTASIQDSSTQKLTKRELARQVDKWAFILEFLDYM